MASWLIETDPEISYVWSRNGLPYIKRLEVMLSKSFPKRDNQGQWDGHSEWPATVRLTGVNKRGNVLEKSGFELDAAAMDNLALTWLRQRGLLPAETSSEVP